MSAILLNLNNFLFETEVELDDKFIDMYEGKLKTAARGVGVAAAGATAGVAAAKGANIAGIPTNSDIIGKTVALGKSVIDSPNILPGGGKLFTTDNVGPSNITGAAKALGSEIINSPVAHMAGVGAAAALGAAALFKYKNSIMRGQYLVNHYSKLASQARNPAEKQKYEQRISWAKSKLATAQSKARIEHKNFIEKSQRMKSHINELNKAGRRQEAAKLQEKLAKRQRFLSKIGATI